MALINRPKHYSNMKKTLLLLFLALSTLIVNAQDFEYGKYDEKAMDMKKYDKDTSAHAVVLQEYGSSRVNVFANDEIKLTFEYHVKIKIFDTRGFDSGTVEIKLRNNQNNESAEELENVSGFTYYTDDNGMAQRAELDPKKVYTTRDYKYQSTAKFAMPGLHNGCIIEYRYIVNSPINFFLDHFHPWAFQGDIPKITSEYEVHIPGHFYYNISLRGPHKLTKNTSNIERECFSVSNAKSDCSHIIFGMSDVPAFIEEDHMTAAKNFISAMEFELVEYTNPFTGLKTKMTREWRDIDYQLKSDESFGSQLKRKELMKERIAPVIAGKTDPLEKAMAIYKHLQKWFKWNDYIGIYSADGIKKAYDSHSGSIADINLALVAALNSAGINTEAVLLSTRNHGSINNLFPAINDFNYVIARATIGDKSYFLDATDPLLPFGILPLQCLNDKGRAFSLDKPSYWVDLETKQREVITYAFDLTLQDNGKLKGNMLVISSGYDAYLGRKNIKKFNTTDEYVENLGERLIKFKILNSEITNLDSLDKPLQEKYDVEIEAYNNINRNRLIFNPFILNRQKVNPFKLAERTYPVDWGMPSEERYLMLVHLPKDYSLENPPQNAAFAMPNQGGKFLIAFDADGNSFTVSHVTQFTKSIYTPEEYPYLKELYNKIIQAEKTELVLKKNL